MITNMDRLGLVGRSNNNQYYYPDLREGFKDFPNFLHCVWPF